MAEQGTNFVTADCAHGASILQGSPGPPYAFACDTYLTTLAIKGEAGELRVRFGSGGLMAAEPVALEDISGSRNKGIGRVGVGRYGGKVVNVHSVPNRPLTHHMGRAAIKESFVGCRSCCLHARCDGCLAEEEGPTPPHGESGHARAHNLSEGFSPRLGQAGDVARGNRGENEVLVKPGGQSNPIEGSLHVTLGHIQ
jgi:hypothetical protein